MKLLTLWEPWATAIALGIKKYETRHWQTSYRGLLAIHSAKKRITKEILYSFKSKYPDYENLIQQANANRGNIIALCDLTNCLFMDEKLISQQTTIELVFGNWDIGRYAWELQGVTKLNNPVPCRGSQSLKPLDEEFKLQLESLRDI